VDLVELVDAAPEDAVVLAATAALHDEPRLLHVGEGRIRPGVAREALLELEPGAGALAERVLAQQMPPGQVVIAELGVVRDVLEVLEDLPAGTRDGDCYFDGIHGREVYPRGPLRQRVA
jgi:hypothetical protein